jgi:hypothetical protein
MVSLVVVEKTILYQSLQLLGLRAKISYRSFVDKIKLQKPTVSTVVIFVLETAARNLSEGPHATLLSVTNDCNDVCSRRLPIENTP